MTVEYVPLTEGVEATVSVAAVPTDELDADWLCDICTTRESSIRLELESKDEAYERRVCSANPAHVKLIPV